MSVLALSYVEEVKSDLDPLAFVHRDVPPAVLVSRIGVREVLGAEES